MFVHRTARLSTSPFPQTVENHAPSGVGYPQTVDNSWGQGCGRLGTTGKLSTADGRPVGGLLKVLGTTSITVVPPVHSLGEKTRGLPVDNQWTTVDNLGVAGACGPGHGLYPWFSTATSPVDNVSDLRGRRFSTVCTGAMKTMSYLF